MKNTNKFLCAATFAAFSLWTPPAMAQVSEDDGFSQPPSESGFFAPKEYGVGCSRERPKECTPDQRDAYNEIIAFFCATGGGIVGLVDGIIVTGLVGATVVGAPAAPVAGSVHGLVVGGAAYLACYSQFKIPNP